MIEFGLVFMICASFSASAQNFGETHYLNPSHHPQDSSGRIVALVIGDRLYEMAARPNMERLRRADAIVDQEFRDKYMSGLLSRDSSGFLLPGQVLAIVKKGNSIPTRVLCVYDATAQSDFIRWRSVIEQMSAIAGPVAGFIGGPVQDSYDSIWCKISLFDFELPDASFHLKLFSSSSNCHGDPIDCIEESLESLLRRRTIVGSAKDVFVDTPHDQHWGKIIGGVGICVGGITLLTLSRIMDQEFRQTGIGVGATLCVGGTGLLTFGILKQVRYVKWRYAGE
jgi:hypothetical protein